MKQRKCPICNKEKFSTIYSENNKNNLKYAFCENCYFILKNPIGKIYKESFYSNKIYYSAKDPKSLSLKRRFADILREIRSEFKSKNIEILDFGCGNGNFLNYLKKKGYNKLSGYELYLNEIKKNKIFITNQLKKLKKTYNIITLNHVLEHVENPLKTIQKVKSLLKPDGFIIIEVPDNSIYEKYGLKPGNYVDEHFSQFTLGSLYNLSIVCNIQIVRSKTIDCIANQRDPFIPSIIVKIKKNLDQIKNNHDFKRKIKNKKKLIIKKLNKIKNSKITLFGCGDGMKYIMKYVNTNNIKFLIDNNPKLTNKFYQGKKVYNANKIKFLTKNDFIIISALNIKNVIQIQKQIKKINKDVKIVNF